MNSPNNFDTVYKQLTELRANRGLTLEEMGALCGMTKSQASRLCAGARDAKVSSLDKAANALRSRWVLVPDEHSDAVASILADKGAQ